MDVNFDHNLRHKGSIGKYVKVKTVNSHEHEGWLKCIDPMTGNLILVVLDEQCKNVIDVCLIQGHAYNSLEVLKEDDSMKEHLENLCKQNTVNSEISYDRKERLLSWIQKHNLPVNEENGNIIVARKIIIGPPYRVENCQGINRVFLKNIAKLVAEMPNDYKAENRTLTSAEMFAKEENHYRIRYT